MAIQIVSHIYPTKHDPSSGIFIQREAHLVQVFSEIELHIPSVIATPFQSQFYRSHRPVEENFPVHRFKYLSIPKRKFPKLTQKFLSSGLLHSLQNSNTSLVHLHWLFPGALSAPALKKAGYKVVLTIHGGDWYSNVIKNKLNDILEKSLHACDHIITVGKQLKSDIISVYPTLSDKITHVPHAIDTQKFLPSESKVESQNQLGWNTSKIHILSVGNLFKVKGVDLLIEAFSHLTNKGDLHLHLVTPRKDHKLMEQVYSFIKNHSLGNKITFYESMSEDELIPFYQAADLFVSASLKEGFGLAIAEAAACGTPVLATRSGGPEEIITPALGQLIEPGNADLLATSIAQILSNIDHFDSQEMHKAIKSRFSIEQKIDSLRSIYRSYS
ncbi:MAG: hypothetical protein CL666_11535 [Balneola sp.]|mgnify:CR=1 FL=1|nr:hypothetical protein [Balneola sp.]